MLNNTKEEYILNLIKYKLKLSDIKYKDEILNILEDCTRNENNSKFPDFIFKMGL